MSGDARVSLRGRLLADLPTATQQALKRLRQRAIRLLAAREYSRVQLERRLAVDRSRQQAPAHQASDDPTAGRCGPDAQAALPDRAACIEWVLDDLQTRGWLNDERFARELVRRQSPRTGVLRLRHELQRQGVDAGIADRLLRDARGGEAARAHALWQRRFGAPSSDPRERARQARYLSSRGFSADIVCRIVSGRDTPDDSCC